MGRDTSLCFEVGLSVIDQSKVTVSATLLPLL